MSNHAKLSHFIVYPVKGTERCSPGEHDAWAIDGARDGAPDLQAGVVGPDREVSQVLAGLLNAYPDMEGRVSVRWIDEAGATQETSAGTPDDVMDELMEIVSDETPDDAPNTDEHPLEEARSFLLELSDLGQDGPEP
ncbi:hypothetical protein AB9K35_17330 [Leisingera sp. XS_AS12]|uniref:hypothetical protein n=1 Tax=Leisingera sp. XS_AS12 TaxID=3241294 RepID=UPI003516A25B